MKLYELEDKILDVKDFIFKVLHPKCISEIDLGDFVSDEEIYKEKMNKEKKEKIRLHLSVCSRCEKRRAEMEKAFDFGYSLSFLTDGQDVPETHDEKIDKFNKKRLRRLFSEKALQKYVH